MAKILEWVKKNRFEAFWLSIILLAAAFLRLYKIDEYMTFLGDEGRDAMIVRRLLVDFDPILIGPGTSIGNMYLGPLYYYLIAPFLFLANFSPAGPSVMVALFGIVTVFMVWYVVKEWFYEPKLGNKQGSEPCFSALAASALYAVSPVVVTYSRSSWNPNIMPFFSLLCIYSIWRVYKKFEFKWLTILGVSFAFVLNSHYLGLLLIPPLLVYWLLTFLKLRLLNKSKVKSESKSFFKHSIFGLALFLFLMSPVVIFDARHGWRNFTAIKDFFTVRQTTVSIRPWSSIPKLIPLGEKITGRLVAGQETIAGNWIFTIIIFTSVLLVIKSRKQIFSNKILDSAYLLIFFWLGFALIGLGLYKQEIYDHYYGFFFPAPFILIGGLSQNIVQSAKLNGFIKKIFIYFILFLFFIYLFFINLKNNHLQYPPNRQLQRSMAVTKEIENESLGQEFNLAVIAERNYEGAYQYFLEKDNAPIVMIDPQISGQTIKSQLFVVCEMPPNKCDPTHNPKAGIANFGWSKIESQKEINGVILYKLVHSR